MILPKETLSVREWSSNSTCSEALDYIQTSACRLITLFSSFAIIAQNPQKMLTGDCRLEQLEPLSVRLEGPAPCRDLATGVAFGQDKLVLNPQ